MLYTLFDSTRKHRKSGYGEPISLRSLCFGYAAARMMLIPAAFKVRGEAHCGQSSDAKVLEPGQSVKLRHGSFDPCTEAVPVSKLGGVFLSPSLGQTDRFIVVPEIAALFAGHRRTRFLSGTATARFL